MRLHGGSPARIGTERRPRLTAAPSAPTQPDAAVAERRSGATGRPEQDFAVSPDSTTEEGQDVTRRRYGSSGGRTWWAHFKFTRINIEPIILRKKIEE